LNPDKPESQVERSVLFYCYNFTGLNNFKSCKTFIENLKCTKVS